jgi:hypothetical protein
VSGTLTDGADVAIVLAGPYVLDPAALDVEEVTPARQSGCAAVVTALAGAGLATAVGGPDQAPGDLVRRVHEDRSLARAASTVTAPGPGAESITLLWAAAAELQEVHGAYGAEAADGILPSRLPAPAHRPEEPAPSAAPSQTPGAGA